jgi:hypothetical protein
MTPLVITKMWLSTIFELQIRHHKNVTLYYMMTHIITKKITHCLSGHTKQDKNKLSKNNVWRSGSSQKNCWKKSPPLILWWIVFYVTHWLLLCDGYSRHKIVPYVTAQHNCHKRSWHYMTTSNISSRHTFCDALFVMTGFRHDVFFMTIFVLYMTVCSRHTILDFL